MIKDIALEFKLEHNYVTYILTNLCRGVMSHKDYIFGYLTHNVDISPYCRAVLIGRNSISTFSSQKIGTKTLMMERQKHKGIES